MKPNKLFVLTVLALPLFNFQAFANDQDELKKNTPLETTAKKIHLDVQEESVDSDFKAAFIPDLLGVWNLIISRTQEIRNEADQQTRTLQHGMEHHRNALFENTTNVRNDIVNRMETNSDFISQRIIDETGKVTGDVIDAKEAIQQDLTDLTAQIATLAEQGVGLGILTVEEFTAMIDEIKSNRELYQREIEAFDSEKERFLSDFVIFISSLLEVTEKGIDLGLMGTADIKEIARVDLAEFNSVLSNLPNDVLYPLYRVLGRELRSWTEMNRSISDAIEIVSSPLRAQNPFINNSTILISSVSKSSLTPFHKQMEFCDSHILNNFDNLSQALQIMDYYNTISKVLASLLIEDVLKSADTTVYEYSIVKSFKFPQISKPGVWVMMKLLDTAPKISGEITAKLKPLLNSCATNDHIRSSQKAQLDILTQICGSMRSCSVNN